MVKPTRVPPYRIEVIPSEEDGGYIAHLLEFPSLSAFGPTEEKAVREIKRATAAWLDSLAAEGKKPPEPIATREFSGAFRLRLPKELHRKLALEARRNRTSLNTYCIQKLAGRDPD
jgi:predicted HicB family RNase H-like nuclease